MISAPKLWRMKVCDSVTFVTLNVPCGLGLAAPAVKFHLVSKTKNKGEHQLLVRKLHIYILIYACTGFFYDQFEKGKK